MKINIIKWINGILFTVLCLVAYGDKISNRAFLADTNYYYATFDKIGCFKPIHPISKDQTLKAATYYVAKYNANQQLLSLSKYLNGRLEWLYVYQYDSSNNLINCDFS